MEEPKIKLTTFWQEYYEFMRRLFPLLAKGKITKAQYAYFETFSKKLPYYKITKDEKEAKFLINTVSRIFVNNAFFRKIFDGYTIELRNEMVKGMKNLKGSKLMRQKMYETLLKQDPDGFDETDTTIAQKVHNVSVSATVKKFYTPDELRAAAMKEFGLDESDMAKPETHTHKYNYAEYFLDDANGIRLQFDSGETIDWKPNSYWTKYMFVATNDPIDEAYDATGRVIRMTNSYTADIVSDKDMLRNRFDGYDTYAEARQAILNFFGLR
jgi:hypothetical protein